MPEKDYSYRSLIDKLNVKPGARVLLLGVNDAALLADLRARTDDCSSERKKADCDVVLLGAESLADLRSIESCRGLLAPAGGLWVIYPKGQKHITEANVRAAGLAIGMVDNKVISFSPTHTGLRFVIRNADRVVSGRPVSAARKTEDQSGKAKRAGQQSPLREQMAVNHGACNGWRDHGTDRRDRLGQAEHNTLFMLSGFVRDERGNGGPQDAHAIGIHGACAEQLSDGVGHRD